jgi:5-methylcytosine-specific restriction endonuclease McrA
MILSRSQLNLAGGGILNWFKFHHEAMTDAKVQTLDPALFRAWVNILCMASANKPRGILPPIKQVAYILHVSKPEAERIVAELVAEDLIDEVDGQYQPHNWGTRQGKESTSTERVNKYRQKLRDNGEKVGAHLAHKSEVFKRDGDRCVYCNSTVKLVLDHLIPVSRGGASTADNLVCACKACNAGKAGRLVEETGYSFQRRATALQYEAAKLRFGIDTPDHLPSVTVTETVTKKPVTESVTDLSPPVTPLEEIREEEKREREEESLSNDNNSSRGGDDEVVVDGGTFRVISHEHRKTIDHARAVVSERFAAVVADQGSSLDSSLGGRWDCYRAAIDSMKACGKRIDRPAVYCRQTALNYVLHGIPKVTDMPLEPVPSRAPVSAAARPLTAYQAYEAAEKAKMKDYVPPSLRGERKS